MRGHLALFNGSDKTACKDESGLSTGGLFFLACFVAKTLSCCFRMMAPTHTAPSLAPAASPPDKTLIDEGL